MTPSPRLFPPSRRGPVKIERARHWPRRRGEDEPCLAWWPGDDHPTALAPCDPAVGGLLLGGGKHLHNHIPIHLSGRRCLCFFQINSTRDPSRRAQLSCAECVWRGVEQHARICLTSRRKKPANGPENQQSPPASCPPQLVPSATEQDAKQQHPSRQVNPDRLTRAAPQNLARSSSKRESKQHPAAPSKQHARNPGPRKATTASHLISIPSQIGSAAARPHARTHASRSLQHPQRQPPAAASPARPLLAACPPSPPTLPCAPAVFFQDWTDTTDRQPEKPGLERDTTLLVPCSRLPSIHPSVTYSTHTTTTLTHLLSGTDEAALDAVRHPCRCHCCRRRRLALGRLSTSTAIAPC